MAERLSTGLRNFLLGEGSMRKAFEDGVLKIYSGSAPADADDAISGVLLVTITKASGAVSSTEHSVPKIHHVTIPDEHAGAATVILNVTVDGVGPTSYTFTNTPDAGTAAQVMIEVAEMINKIPQLMAIADVTAREMYVQSRIAGLDFTLADGAGTITATVDAAVQAASRSDAMYFGAPSAGAMSKAVEVWSGLVATSGVAGYMRLVQPDDDGTDSSTQVRLQGSVSTSGAELNLSNTSLVAATTLTIDTFSITLPAE